MNYRSAFVEFMEASREARSREAEDREVKADIRAHESLMRERRAEKRSTTAACLGWVSLGITALTAGTVVYYTVLTKSMAESAQRQVDIMASQREPPALPAGAVASVAVVPSSGGVATTDAAQDDATVMPVPVASTRH